MTRSKFEEDLRSQLTAAAATHVNVGRLGARLAPVALAALGLVLAAAVILPLLRLGGLDGSESPAHSGSSEVLDLKPASVLEKARVPRGATDIAVDQNGVWVVGIASITHVDPVTGTIVDNFPYKGEDFARIAVGEGSVWATAGFGGIQRVDPKSGAVVRDFPVTGLVRDISVGGGYVWAIELGVATPRLLRIDPNSDEVVVMNGDLSAGASDLAFSADGLWVSNNETGGSRLVEPSSGSVLRSVDGIDPATVGTATWTVAEGEVTDRRQSGAVVRSIRIVRAARMVRDAQGALWVLSLPGSLSDTLYEPDPSRPGTISQLDPNTGSLIGGPVPFGVTPASMAPAGKGVWVVEYDSGKLVHIG